MKLKCIGGKCDGMIIDVDDIKYRQGDGVRVPDYPTTISEFKVDPIPTISVNYEIYIIDVLKYNEGSNKHSPIEIWFLRPQNFTVFDAMRFQFLK